MKKGKSNLLSLRFPHLLKEWHPTKNIGVDVSTITAGLDKKVWWICSKGHSWNGRIANRTNKNLFLGCPFCSGQQVCIDNCLATLKPIVAKQWHPHKNGTLTPYDVTYGSGKKVWWRCKYKHEWSAIICNMTKKVLPHGCPYCSGRRVDSSNCLNTRFPNIAKDWHPLKNGSLTSYDVVAGSNKKVWWVCILKHEWVATVGNRTNKKKKSGCPYCAGQKVCIDNCLFTKNPNIAKEWNKLKNGELKPIDVVSGSERNVWWVCNFGHEWRANINSRTRKKYPTGCPFCFTQSSLIELRLYTELKKFFIVNNRYKVEKFEIDLYLPEYKIGIEYDGSYWHRNKYLFDEKKTKYLQLYGINLLHIREFGLKKIAKLDILLQKGDTEFTIISKLLKRLINLININTTLINKINTYLNAAVFTNGKEYSSLINNLPKPIKENSLATLRPDLCKYWDYESNNGITPFDVYFSSSKKVWWLCPKGHKYNSSINRRTNKRTISGCPYCSGKKVSIDNCLLTKNYGTSKEWHPFKNGSLTPSQVTPGSDKKVWWLCKLGHEWESCIYNRTIIKNPKGCPYCSNRKVSKENCLETKFPIISKEWHPLKNKKLTPKQVTAGSGKKVWWLCNFGHEWKTNIYNRAKQYSTGCPHCYKLKRKIN